MNDLELVESDVNTQWFTIEELADMTGYASGNALLANPMTNELLNSFNNSNDVEKGGYHNTQKFYSENVLNALKEYQLKNTVQNAVKNKETVASGNSSYLANVVENKPIESDIEYFKLQEKMLSYASNRLQELIKENAMQKEQLKEQAPKVEFFDAVADSKDAIDMQKASKVLNMGIGRNTLFDILRKKGVLDRYNIPYQKYINLGYFRTIETRYIVGEEVRVGIKTLVFQKGLNFIKKVVSA